MLLNRIDSITLRENAIRLFFQKELNEKSNRVLYEQWIRFEDNKHRNVLLLLYRGRMDHLLRWRELYGERQTVEFSTY